MNNETAPRDERLGAIAEMTDIEIEELLGLPEGDPANTEEVAAARRGADRLAEANPDMDADELLLAAHSERITSDIEIPDTNVAVDVEGNVIGMGQSPRDAAADARGQMGLM